MDRKDFLLMNSQLKNQHLNLLTYILPIFLRVKYAEKICITTFKELKVIILRLC